VNKTTVPFYDRRHFYGEFEVLPKKNFIGVQFDIFYQTRRSLISKVLYKVAEMAAHFGAERGKAVI
jgi:hypothetical protein